MASSEIRVSKVTAALVEAIVSGNLPATKKNIELGADVTISLQELEVFPGIRVRLPNYDLSSLLSKYKPRSILGCAVLQQDSGFTEAVLNAHTGRLEFPTCDELLALEHCSVDVFRVLLTHYWLDFCDDLCWRRWRKRDFNGNLIVGRMETEFVHSSALLVIVKTLGYSARIDSYYGGGVLSVQVEKLRMLYDFGFYGNNLLLTLINGRHRYAVENLLRWGVLSCSGLWETIIGLCISNRWIGMLSTILKNDRSTMPSRTSCHMPILSETLRLDIIMNATKVERLVRILINCNFPFYGTSYRVSYDDTATKIMLLQFAGVEVTDYDRVSERSPIYQNSLSDNILNKLPIQFASMSEAASFAKQILMTHNAKRLIFLCKLQIRKSLGTCQNMSILKDRVEMLPLPKKMKEIVASSFI